MKKRSLICLLSSIATSTTLLPILFTATSCSEPVLPENIHTHEQSLFAFDHSFELKVVSNGVFPKETKVTLINEGRELSIVSISFEDKNAFITMNISEDIHYDTIIKYALSFEYKDKYITVDNLNVFYVYQGEDERKDKIAPVEKIIQNIQDRTFNFKFQFSAMPKGPITPLIVEGDEDLSIPEGTYVVEKDPNTGLLFLNIPIKLSDSIATDRTFDFALTLSFMNSFGDEQTTKVENLSCYFLTDKSLDIPSEYYVIDKNGVLYGFTDFVKNNPQLIRAYRKITIPYNVTSIAQDAFNVSFSLSNITDLQFNEQVSSVGDHAFTSLTRLETFDYTSWNGQHATQGIPSWIYSDDNTEIFNLKEVSFRKGFILTPNTTGEKSLWAEHLLKHGLGYKRPNFDKNYLTWSVYHADEVSKDGWFKIEHNNYGYEIIGLNTDAGGVTPEEVEKCGLIKIPLFVNTIKQDSNFQYFGQHPSKVDGIAQRRICLGPNISSLESQYSSRLFAQAGLYSCITIPERVGYIDAYTFYQADRNGDGQIGTQPISISFYPKYEGLYYKAVDEYAFSDMELEYIKIPDGWNESFKPHHEVSMGSRVFADSRIRCIDMSELSDVPNEYFATRGENGTFAGMVGQGDDITRYIVIPKDTQYKYNYYQWLILLYSDLGAVNVSSGYPFALQWSE